MTWTIVEKGNSLLNIFKAQNRERLYVRMLCEPECVKVSDELSLTDIHFKHWFGEILYIVQKLN